MNKKLIFSTSSENFQEKSFSRTTKELQKISKDLRYKKPLETRYYANSIEFEQSQSMVRHRANFSKSKILNERHKSETILNRDISMILDPIFIEKRPEIGKELVNSLGLPMPDALFCLSNDLGELKKQVERENLRILTDGEVGIKSFQGFATAGMKKNMKPAGNKDVDLLEEWVDSMLTRVVNNTSSQSELFESTQIVYSAALQEIIRQVSLHCNKRGELLNRIWKAYFNLMVTAIKKYQTSKISAKIKAITDVKTAESRHTEIAKSLRAEILNYKEEIELLKIDLKSLKKTSDKAVYHERLVQNKYTVLLGKYERDQMKMIRLEDTNQNLNHLVKNVLEDLDSELPGMKKLQEKKKIRFRDLSKMMISDPLLNSLKNDEINEFIIQVPETDADRGMELKNIELENSKFIQEINQKIEDTEEEMFDKAVDTREFLVLAHKDTETDAFDFVVPVVDVGAEACLAKKKIFEEEMLKVLTGNNLIDDKEVEEYFDLKDNKENSESDCEEELANVVEEDIRDITNKNIIRTQIRYVISNNYMENNKIYKKALRKLQRLKTIKNNYEVTMKNLRKTIFATVKENNLLRSKTISPMHPEKHRKTKTKIIIKTEKKAIKRVAKEPNSRKESILLPVQQDFTTPSKSILNKIISGRCSEKLNMTKKAFLKFTSTFISEYNSVNKEKIAADSLHTLLYLVLTQRYTNQKIVKSNFTQILLACNAYSSTNELILLFGRFFGLHEPLGIEYFNMYIEISEILNSSCKPTEMFEDHNDETWVSLFKCEENISVYWRSKIIEEEHQEMREKLEALVKQCPKNINLCGVVSKANLVNLHIWKLSQYLQKSKNNNKDLFNGADLSRDGYMNIREFERIFKNTDKANFTKFYCKLLFTTYSDLIVEIDGKEKPMLSYGKFSVLCVEKGLFKIESQNLFLGIKDSKELQKAYENLWLNREEIIKQLKWRTGKLHGNRREVVKMINSLNERILKNDQERANFIGYRLLEEDTVERIIEGEIRKALPGFCRIFQKARDILGTDRHPLRREKGHATSKNDTEEDDLF